MTPQTPADPTDPDRAASGLALTTRAVHPPVPQHVQGRPVSVPIYQTTVFAHDDAETLTDSLDNPRGAFVIAGRHCSLAQWN